LTKKAAVPLHMHGSMVHPTNTCFLGPTQVHNPNGTPIGSAIFAQLMAVSSGMIGCVLSPKNCAFTWDDLVPIQYMVPWAHPSPNPKRHLDWFSRFLHSSPQSVPVLYSGLPLPSKLPLPMGASGPPSTTWFLGPPQSST